MPRRNSHNHGALTGSGGRDGPTGMSGSATNPLVHHAWKLASIIPHAVVQHEHYDQRNRQCVRCGNVPKYRAALDDTDEGFICRAVGACAKRAKENN